MEELVSIIIPIYNAEEHLTETLESVRNQTYQNIEVLLVDDGSTDGSGAICDKYAAEDMRFCVYHIKNGGSSNARNYALDRIKGNYVMFVDSDDLVKANYVQIMLYVALKTDRSIITCDHINGKNNSVDAFIDSIDVHDPEYEIIALPDYLPLNHYTHMEVWAALYKAQLVEDIRFSSDISVGEDTLFFYQSLKKSGEAVFINICLYYYRYRDSSVYHRAFSKVKLTCITAMEKVIDTFRDMPESFLCEYRALTGIVCKNYMVDAIECNCDDKHIKHYLYKKTWYYFSYVLQSKQLRVVNKLAYVAFLCSPVFYTKLKRLIL